MNDGVKFSRVQRRIFVGCFVAYATAYIARLNLSAALPGLTASMGLTDAQGGLLQTLFALTYAAGQLVNGAIVDRISARRFIVIGLTGSAACNVLFGLANAYWMLLALWCLNGAAQSMLWTPVVKLLAHWFEGKRRERVSFYVSLTLIAGMMAAWAISGYMAQIVTWRYSFIVPGVLAAAVAVLSRFVLMDGPEEAPSSDKPRDRGQMAVSKLLTGTGLGVMLLCCVANGFVRDGVMTWAPTIIANIGSGLAISSVGISLIIPVIKFMGVLLGKSGFQRLGGNARSMVEYMMAGGALVCALLALFGLRAMLGCALLLGLLCAFMSGLNPMLTSLMPMEYDCVKRVGLVAGMIDASIYIGSALAGVLTGALSGSYGWTSVFVVWIGVSLLGALCAFASARQAKAWRKTMQ